jgi:AhpD family alkylhydroperoxidase
MEPRLRMARLTPDMYQEFIAFGHRHEGGVEPLLAELVKLRASQINHCAFCLDMHYKDARALGETEERLYMLPAWREASVYSERERAALALTEAITELTDGYVPDDVYDAAAKVFDEKELATVIWLVAIINTWNRLNVTTRNPAGSYRSTKQPLT